MKNAVGREIPEKIGDYVVKPYRGAYVTEPGTEKACGRQASMYPETVSSLVR